jgi:hypothetical protein
MGSNPVGIISGFRKISGSRIAAILGESEYKTEVDIWLDILSEIDPEFVKKYNYEKFEGNASTRFGTAFEDSLISLTQKKLSCEIKDREKFFCVGNRTCHIDGIISGEKLYEGNKLYEGKTSFEMAFRNKFGTPDTDRIPREYMIQVQHNLDLCGLKESVMSVLVFPKSPEEWEEMGWQVEWCAEGYILKRYNEDKTVKNCLSPGFWADVLFQMGYFHNYYIQENKDVQKMLKELSEEWWQKHIIERKEPEPKNYEDLKMLIPEPVGTILADDELEKWAVEYREITKEIGKSGRLEKRKETLKFNILNKMRSMDKHIDNDTRERTKLVGQDGKRLITWNGKMFRA